MGVLISWDMLAKKADFNRSLSSAFSLAFNNSISVFLSEDISVMIPIINFLPCSSTNLDFLVKMVNVGLFLKVKVSSDILSSPVSITRLSTFKNRSRSFSLTSSAMVFPKMASAVVSNILQKASLTTNNLLLSSFTKTGSIILLMMLFKNSSLCSAFSLALSNADSNILRWVISLITQKIAGLLSSFTMAVNKTSAGNSCPLAFLWIHSNRCDPCLRLSTIFSWAKS